MDPMVAILPYCKVADRGDQPERPIRKNSAVKLLSKSEALRIVVNIIKLPKFLKGPPLFLLQPRRGARL
jgi:hypothetical protein